MGLSSKAPIWDRRQISIHRMEAVNSQFYVKEPTCWDHVRRKWVLDRRNP